MGRVIKREVIAIRCEVATPRRRRIARCDAVEAVLPVPAGSEWEEQVRDLARLVDKGWAFVIVPSLRSYCPAHALRAMECTCNTNRDRTHLCIVHGHASSLVWTQNIVPSEVRQELTRIGVSA